MSRSGDVIKIRMARLDDTAGIVDVHRSHVGQWYRQIDSERHDVGYDSLTIDERFGFGGPWMSPETCSVHLNHLLLRRQLPLVVETGGRIVAQAELFIGREGKRYGKNCHIGLLFVHRDFLGQGIGARLIDHAVQVAGEQDCDTLTVASDEIHEQFYRRSGFSFGESLVFVEMSTGKRPADYEVLPPQVSAQSFAWGMDMVMGRVQSSAQHLSEYADNYAIATYGEITHRMHFLRIGGYDTMVALVGHGSGMTVAGAWSRDADLRGVAGATLALAGAAGIRAVKTYMFVKDYESIKDGYEARVIGQRHTLMRRL